MTSLNAPQPALSWQHTIQDVEQLTIKALESNKKVNDSIVELPKDKLGFDNVFLALANAEAELKIQIEPLTFYMNVSTSRELRDAATSAEERHRQFALEESMREDLYATKVAAETNLRRTGAWEKLSSEQKRLVEKMLLDGERAGLGLKEEDKDRLKALKNELTNHCMKFSQNYSEDTSRVSFTREELDGVSEDVISGYTQRTEGGEVLYEVTFTVPDIFPVFGFANNPETRRRAWQTFESRLAVNVEPFNAIVRLRRQIAEILGYNSWADYATEVRMAKSAANVKQFLEELQSYLNPIARKELATLLAIKKEDHVRRGLPVDDHFYPWDCRYYERLYVEQNLRLDESLIQEYFPVSFIVPAILDIYQNLLGVEFVEVNGETKNVWHSDVQQFTVWEKDAKDESGFIGHCYLDLFPRDGKYPHAAAWCLLPGYELPGGKRHYPLASLVANLAKPTPDRPALMRHADVITFFHEFGHVFHELLSRTRYSRFHGPLVALDFAEAPSQMLENWCWEPEVLKKMSSHYKSQEPLSDDLIVKLIKSRYTNVAHFYLRQLHYANFDLLVHDNSLDVDTDYTKFWNELRRDITHLEVSEYQPGQGTFEHVVCGYDVGYYGYTYSLVFAADMYATVFKNGPLNPKLGKLYRDKILRVGGTRDDMDSLRDFLGREPNPKAFINEIENAATNATN